MSSSLEYVLALIVSLVVWFLWSFRGKSFSEIKSYFKSDDGLGVLKGIVIAVVFAMVLVILPGCSGTYFNDASVYAGLDYTKNQSPQCEDSGPDSHTTSNLGLRGNIYESEDGKFRTNAKYTHHSCAFSPDDASYDAVGIEMEYKIWDR
jgi:hypothetical protein